MAEAAHTETLKVDFSLYCMADIQLAMADECLIEDTMKQLGRAIKRVTKQTKWETGLELATPYLEGRTRFYHRSLLFNRLYKSIEGL